MKINILKTLNLGFDLKSVIVCVPCFFVKISEISSCRNWTAATTLATPHFIPSSSQTTLHLTLDLTNDLLVDSDPVMNRMLTTIYILV